MERFVIPKDCLLCDVCNKAITDESFVATEDMTWYEGWLYCKDCEARHKPSMKKIMSIYEGDYLGDTDLALPMVIESF